MARHEVAVGWTDHTWNLMEVEAPVDAEHEDIEAEAVRMLDAYTEAFAKNGDVAFVCLHHRATEEE